MTRDRFFAAKRPRSSAYHQLVKLTAFPIIFSARTVTAVTGEFTMDDVGRMAALFEAFGGDIHIVWRRYPGRLAAVFEAFTGG